MGLLAALFFLLTPRLFAEGFYNSKDIVFLAAFAIAMNTGISFILKPSIYAAVIHGIATAFAIDIRIMAIMIPILTFAFFITRIFYGQILWRRGIAFLVLYTATTIICVVLFWPWLWNSPASNFAEALLSFSRWVRSDIMMLYLGDWIRSTDLPWHYVPVWIAITTPPIFLVLGVFGVVKTLHSMLQEKWLLCQSEVGLQNCFFLAVLLGPILAVIILHSVIYDGWRHLYFIYPAFVLLCMVGWSAIWSCVKNHVILKTILGLSLICALLNIFMWMYQAHPLQNTYFNFLVKSPWKDQFDLDYWGLANRQALEKILENDSRPKIYIRAGSNTPLYHSLKVLNANDRSRFEVIVDENKADYVVSNFRGKTVSDNFLNAHFLPFATIQIDDQEVVKVYKRVGF